LCISWTNKETCEVTALIRYILLCLCTGRKSIAGEHW